jgi:hypothetical protein
VLAAWLLSGLPNPAWASYHSGGRAAEWDTLWQWAIGATFFGTLGGLVLVTGLVVAMGKGRAQRRAFEAAPPAEPGETPAPVGSRTLLAQGLGWGIAAAIAVMASLTVYSFLS